MSLGEIPLGIESLGIDAAPVSVAGSYDDRTKRQERYEAAYHSAYQTQVTKPNITIERPNDRRRIALAMLLENL